MTKMNPRFFSICHEMHRYMCNIVTEEQRYISVYSLNDLYEEKVYRVVD